MRKESPTRSPKPSSSTALLVSLFGKGVVKSLGAFKSKSPAERAMAASRARVRTLEIKLNVAKRTALAVSRVRRKKLASAELKSISLAGKVAEVSADRDLLLTANTRLLSRADELELKAYEQKRISQTALETNTLVVECAKALIEADPASFKRIFKSPDSSASRILVTSITKVTSQRPLPGGKSKAGRTSTSSW